MFALIVTLEQLAIFNFIKFNIHLNYETLNYHRLYYFRVENVIKVSA